MSDKPDDNTIPKKEFDIIPDSSELAGKPIELAVPGRRSRAGADAPLIENREPLSEEFQKVLYNYAGGSSLVESCGYCGRLYFGTGGDYNEGERERYEELAANNPEMYIDVSDFTTSCNVNGKRYVIDCICNGPKPVELFLIGHEEIALRFMVARLKEKIDDVEYEKRRFKEAIEGLEL